LREAAEEDEDGDEDEPEDNELPEGGVLDTVVCPSALCATQVLLCEKLLLDIEV
jgi:hypothetical protein